MKEHRHAARDESVEELEHEHHVDREALVVQLRALARSTEHLCDAVERLAGTTGGDARTISKHLEEARWSLREVW